MFGAGNMLLASVGMAVVAVSPAFAQGAEGSAETPQPAQPLDSAAANSDSSGLEEIVVTAQRRAESMQTVPIAVTAVTATDATKLGVEGTTGLTIAAPAVTLNQNPGGSTSVTIRGATGTGTVGDEAAASVYVDGVYMAGTPGLYFDLNNIERVEVLKGPQGTLFGRNSVGGAIQIITRMPKQAPELEASVSYGNYDTVTGQLYATGGLTDTIAIDLSLYGQNQSKGWGRNVFTGDDAFDGDQYSARSKLHWASGDSQLTLFASYNSVRFPSFQGFVIYPGQVNAAGSVFQDVYTVDLTFGQRGRSTQATAGATFIHDFSFGRFTAISGWEDTDLEIAADGDLSRLEPTSLTTVSVGARKFTQELQLASIGDPRFSWIGGLFYMNSTQSASQTSVGQVVVPDTFRTVGSKSPIDSYAAYAQATWEVLSRTKLTFGGRYTIDKRSLEGSSASTRNPIVVPITGKGTDKAFTYRVALSHQVTDDVMVYGSYTTGFKSGLFSLFTPTAPAALPSKVRAWELGFKSEFMRTLRANVSAFYNDYSNVQVRAYTTVNGVTTSATINATDATSKGIDADLEWRPVDALSLRGGLTWMRSRYGSFPTAACNFPNFNGQGLITSYRAAPCDVSGRQTVQSPDLVWTLSANYTTMVAGGNLSLSATTNYNSGFYFDAQNIAESVPRQLWNASIQWRTPGDKWGVRLWGRNLTNKQYFSAVQAAARGFIGQPAEPRIYGVTLDWKM